MSAAEMTARGFSTEAVRQAFASAPPQSRAGMLALRSLVFEVAATLPRIGRVEESLRWGQPAYLTPETGAGSTIRLGTAKPDGFALYVHCRTTLLQDFRAVFANDFTYEGNRAVLFRTVDDIDPAALSHLVRAALTYHLE